MSDADVLLEVEGLTQRFATRTRERGFRRTVSTVTAVEDVTFQVRRGERIGIVGESGSGKSTVARALAGLRRPDAGSVRFDGTEITSLDAAAVRTLRARLQLVLQDPLASLDPRMSVRQIVREGLEAHRPDGDHDAATAAILEQTHIGASLHDRRPLELSGGQRQRVALARSIVLSPDLVVLDEPVSALDISVQAQILNLLLDLQERHQLTYVFIVHDLGVARWFCDRIHVMYRGRIVEEGPSEALFAHARHHYTRELLASIPGSGAGPRAVATGPAPLAHGCAFRHRCPRGHDEPRCAEERPPLAPDATGRRVACHFPATSIAGSTVEVS